MKRRNDVGSEMETALLKERENPVAVEEHISRSILGTVVEDQEEAAVTGRKPHRSRPMLLKMLVAGYLALAWFGWLRAATAIADWKLLADYLSKEMLVYFVVSGSLWGLLGLASALSLWFGMPIASWLTRLAAAGCFVWYWLDRAFLAHSSLTERSLFAWIFSLLALAFAVLVPVLPQVKRYLGRRSKQGE